MPEPDELVRVGRVVKPHGIRGELVVDTTGEALASVVPGTVITVGGAPWELTGLRPHQGRLLVQLAACGDRSAAERLRGAWVELRADSLPELDELEWYARELVGWMVADRHGAAVGRVAAVLEGAAHDYLQLDDDAGSLVPMVRDWIVDIDADARRIALDLPAGLIEGAET